MNEEVFRIARNQLYQKILNAKNIVLVIHHPPDGDGIGAICALADFFERLNKKTILFCRQSIPKNYSFLKKTKEFTSDETVFNSDVSLIIVCDTGDLRFAGIEEEKKRLDGFATVANIDHHQSNTRFGEINLIDSTYSSTCEVVYDILETWGFELDSETATALLLGIINDTDHFSNPATNAKSFEQAALFLEHGARYREIFSALYKTQSEKSLQIWGRALERLRFREDLSIASTYLLLEDIGESEDKEETSTGISNFLNNIPEANIILLLKEIKSGIIRGSLRSTKDYDVSKIAVLFGGGGHKKSAGFTMKGNLQKENGHVKIL